MIGTETGALQRLTVEHLTAAGFVVRPSENPHDGRVQIAGDGALWLFTVTDRGEADLVRWPTDAGIPDPRRLADLATVLLTGRSGAAHPPGTAAAHPELRVNGVAGMELRDRGFTVELKVYSDLVCFDVLSEIQATNPSGADADPRAVVGITDGGVLSWYRDYGPDHADPAAVAGAISAAIAPVLPRPAPRKT